MELLSVREKILLPNVAKKIIIEFRKQGFRIMKVLSEDVYAEFTTKSDTDHDYGVVLLPGPGDSNEGLGWYRIEVLMCIHAVEVDSSRSFAGGDRLSIIIDYIYNLWYY